MISFLKKSNKANKPRRKVGEPTKASALNGGMTYVELIVVLSIFGIMSAIVMGNYGTFQAKVDIKNLASDIALKIVEAQKSAMSGKLQGALFLNNSVKPAYGVYFDSSTNTDTDQIAVNKKFIYFADGDNNYQYSDEFFCQNPNAGYECLDKINITKGNYISSIDTYKNSQFLSHISNPLSITFMRPNSGAVFVEGIYQGTGLQPIIGFDYVEITIAAPNNGPSARIQVYPSGRIQIK